MDKLNVVCPSDGILLKNKKEWTNDTCKNINKPQKHYAKWKRLQKKGNSKAVFFFTIIFF